MTPLIEGFYDPATGTVSYVLADRIGGVAAIIDPVLDYDPKSGRTQTTSADRLIDYVQKQQLTVNWLLETHAHADHLSAVHYLRERVGGNTAISEKIVEVQRIFKRVFNLEHTFALDGSQFDYLLTDGETFELGALTVQALHVPGHTPADMAFQDLSASGIMDLGAIGIGNVRSKITQHAEPGIFQAHGAVIFRPFLSENSVFKARFFKS